MTVCDVPLVPPSTGEDDLVQTEPEEQMDRVQQEAKQRQGPQ